MSVRSFDTLLAVAGCMAVASLIAHPWWVAKLAWCSVLLAVLVAKLLAWEAEE